MLASLPFLAVGFVMLSSVPGALAGWAQVVWLAGALFVFFGAFDLYTREGKAPIGVVIGGDPG